MADFLPGVVRRRHVAAMLALPLAPRAAQPAFPIAAPVGRGPRTCTASVRAR
ncbi:MAG TPA: hypothetical protein VFQ20_01440 [Burkholderiaceae bacterium]|nr:hypothetical protein [Burkholderiaceae bacterium]